MLARRPIGVFRGRREVGMPGQYGEVGTVSAMRANAADLPDPMSPPSATETAESLYKTPTLLAHRVRCGKPTCRCTTGEGHGPYWYLYWRQGGVQRRRYVPAIEVAAVRAVVAGRRAADRTERLGRERSIETWRGMRRWVRDLEHDGRW